MKFRSSVPAGGEMLLTYVFVAGLGHAELVELRRHHDAKIMRWTPWIIGKENGAIAQMLRNNSVAADIVRNNDVAAGWLA